LKQYPSIPTFEEVGIPINNDCIAFEKIDGSNMRAEWSNKKWCKFGTRTRLVDQSDCIFGKFQGIFIDTLSDEISKFLIDNKIQKAIAFSEFYGEHSFAGRHNIEDDMKLAFFDLWIEKKGFVPPREFIKSFSILNIPKVVYEGKLDLNFVNDVKIGVFDVNEGVVAKGGKNLKTYFAIKIKTNAYLEKIKHTEDNYASS
jgi:hypothetical protein